MSVDLRDTIIAKSDQLNSDDLMGGPITVTIRDVTKKQGEKDQPISIFYNGDDNKPWKPCKSMRRVLLQLWGHEGKDYIGRGLTLYRDEKVQWGGEAVGGIRISHMSHIKGEEIMALTATRGSKKQYKVRPLKALAAPEPAPAQTAAPAPTTQAPKPEADPAPNGAASGMGQIDLLLQSGPINFPDFEAMSNWIKTNIGSIKTADTLKAFRDRNAANFAHYATLSPDWMAVIDQTINERERELNNGNATIS